jgi:hypothetical protein
MQAMGFTARGRPSKRANNARHLREIILGSNNTVRGLGACVAPSYNTDRQKGEISRYCSNAFAVNHSKLD